MTRGSNRSRIVRLLLALLLIAAGLALAQWTQTRGGVEVRDVRFRTADGAELSALVYRPAAATRATPAPGILAVHGYINTRETQSAFAIEFARRGYVVVALDQRGHGASGGAATRDGFGGPEGLAYLRSLPFVDLDRIGLEGHSMGGWTVLAAAAAMPDAYRAMILEGSSTGAPFAREGTPAWPRNLQLVYSRYDEFAPLMWDVPDAAAIGTGAKLKTLFGTTAPVEPGRLYGSIAAGTARRLAQPAVTHPGDHLSTAAVGEATDWFARTLGAPTPRPAGDQIWWGKEAGTGLALLGLAALSFALVDLLLARPDLARLRQVPAIAVRPRRWRLAFWLTMLVPPVTYYLDLLVVPVIPVSRLFPQAVSNALMLWALVNIALALALGRLLPRAERRSADWPRSIALAATVLVPIYAIVTLAALLPLDFRFWVVALRPLTGTQPLAFVAYLLPFTLFVAVSFAGLTRLAGSGATTGAQYGIAIAASAGGFLALTGVQYVWLFATGHLPLAFEALNAIVAIQFVPLLAGLAALAVFTWRRTGRVIPAALIGGPFVTWYLVAGTATHVG